MKKIIFASLLFLVLFLYKPISSFAACPPNNGPAALCGLKIACSVSLSENYCCDTQQECDDLKNAAFTDPTCLDGNGINTAIGCIPVSDTNQFMGWILGWAVGVGGGIAFLLIVYASFMVMTSAGDPTRLKAGQELLTSAISGLIMLIFSVFILNFIGIDILGIFTR
jgi:hypothetical protein